MRAVAYSIRSSEKEPLAKANHKKHDITLISNPLGIETAEYAAGKEAVIISMNDHLTATVIQRLADLGVKFIAVRSTSTDNIDRTTASALGIKIAAVPEDLDGSDSRYAIAACTIQNLDRWQSTKHSEESCEPLRPQPVRPDSAI